MSQARVEVVKRGIDAFNRRDLDAYDKLFTQDFELFPAMIEVVEGTSLPGREGIETFFGYLRDAWEDQHFITDEFRDLDDRVLVLGRLEQRGRGSGLPVAAAMGFVVDLRDSKIACVRTYLDHDEALRTAGLSE